MRDEEDYPSRRVEERLIGFYFRSFPSGWYCQNRLRACQFCTEELLPLLDAKTRIVSQVMVTNNMCNGDPIRNMTDRTRYPNTSQWTYPLLHPFSIFENFAVGGVSAGQYAYAQGSVDLARVACGLERYRLWCGKYPASLDALAPQFIDKLPHDIINGQPLHYRLTDNGQFVLYSVGWANKDEGGNVRQMRDPLTDVRNGNWVWRYP
jgi:hypothetical protein